MTLREQNCRLISNKEVGPNLYLMELESDGLMKGAIAGQFVHILIPNAPSHVLRRPFGIYAVDESGSRFDILYQVVGDGTALLTKALPGEGVSVIGPIGNGWSIPSGIRRAMLVGGGVGAAPLYMLAKELVERGIDVDVVLGSQTSAMLVFNERFESLCPSSLACSTDDGSFGFHGFCTPLVVDAIEDAHAKGEPYEYMAVCGPSPLMKIVATAADEHHIPCEVSLEKRMACGVGACLSCVADTVSGKKRVCVDGPVFDAKEVIW